MSVHTPGHITRPSGVSSRSATPGTSGVVHWHEGLFLQPHHLQLMQRNLYQQFATERRLAWAYPYGLIEARLSIESLGNLLVEFDRLHAIMPSGVEVNVGEGMGNAVVPVLSIKERCKSSADPITISLAVPRWDNKRANTIGLGSEDWRQKRMYRVEVADRADENTGDNPQQVQFRKINARLLMDGDDQSDLEVLPLLRIVPGSETSRPRLDETFIPPCMLVGGWPTLREIVRDIANHVDSARRDLVRLLKRDNFVADTMRPRQISQVMRLRTLNRFSARLPALATAPAVSPFEAYLELRELLGELAALNPARDGLKPVSYDHDHPAPVFYELAQQIRLVVAPDSDDTVFIVEMKREHDNNRFFAELTEEHLSLPNEYFLGVRTRHDPRALMDLIEDVDRCKLMPASKSRRSVYGVKLEREPSPPVQLPGESGLHYFRLLREGNRRWDEIREERKLVLEGQVMGIADMQASLYMTVPQGGVGGES